MVEAGTQNAGRARRVVSIILAELGHPCPSPAGERLSLAAMKRRKVDDYTWYNWGYDPVLYNTPGRPRLRDADGTARQEGNSNKWSRRLHQRHIGVVVDVVFNHTASHRLPGPSPSSTRSFPGYYYSATDALLAVTPMPPAAATNSPRKSPWRESSLSIPSNTG